MQGLKDELNATPGGMRYLMIIVVFIIGLKKQSLEVLDLWKRGTYFLTHAK